MRKKIEVGKIYLYKKSPTYDVDLGLEQYGRYIRILEGIGEEFSDCQDDVIVKMQFVQKLAGDEKFYQIRQDQVGEEVFELEDHLS